MTEPDDELTLLSHLARAERAALAGVARAEGMTPEDAVDCVQEGLCTLLGMARRSALPENPREWGAVLAAVVRNVARNRRRRHFRALPHEAYDDERTTGDGDAAARSADEALARAEEHVRLQACVSELCEIQRAVVTLRMLEEQPGEDVAAALGISPNYVAVLLLRAKRALRACMAPAIPRGRNLEGVKSGVSSSGGHLLRVREQGIDVLPGPWQKRASVRVGISRAAPPATRARSQRQPEAQTKRSPEATRKC